MRASLPTPSVNVVRRMYTPPFHLRYTGNVATFAGNPVQIIGRPALTLQATPQNLNGLAINTLVSTTANTFTFPYTGIWSIGAAVATPPTPQATAATHGWQLTSNVGSYGASTLFHSYNGQGAVPLSYTNYFAANDVIRLQIWTASASTLPLAWHVVLLNRFA